MTNRPPHGDMSPEDRLRDRMRHFPTILNRWRGGRASLWHYTISHRSLAIRVERAGVRGNLHVHCGDVCHIQAPTRWENAEIQVELDVVNEFPFVVRDVVAKLEIVCGIVSIAENVKPVYEPPV